ncbi:PAN domain containing protein [Brugia malayi]|uniref:PAN domain containing protein n=1 Tax=Brugia malayi TaxID=6279 RepID=A0A4E9EPT6_BRUMA|nr:PAN domain containing protein [Brugia malayi]VIO85824.1 PAN domain containing protein [Brugia malayi]
MLRLHLLGSISFTLFFSFNSINAEKTRNSGNVQQEVSSFPNAMFCENRLTAFTVSDNKRLVSSSSLVYEDVSEEVCLKMCSNNRDSDGRTIFCASVVYDQTTFACTIFRSKSYPEGDLKIETVPGQRLFEKFCLKDAPIECADSRFLKIDQSVIIGYARNVSLARSVQECIQQCLTEHFQCRSAMYFYAEGECITNTESAMTQPASFAREENDKVIYIQNGCPAILARQKQLENSAIAAAKLSPIAVDDHIEDVKEENPLKERKDLNNDVYSESNEEQSDDAIRTNFGNVSAVEEATTASTIKGMSKILARNLKKLRTDSGTVSFSKRPKSLRQTKLQQIKKEFTSEENEEKHLEKNLPLEEDHFSQWNNWSPCRRPGERSIRRRKCYNLQKCVGALMEVKKCPIIIKEEVKLKEAVPDDHGLQTTINREGLLTSVLPERLNIANKTDLRTAILHGISSQLQQQSHSEKEFKEKTDEKVWSPWRGVCQQFAGGHPCKNHEIIGFESRDCLATDNAKCKGPFFRYCTISC